LRSGSFQSQSQGGGGYQQQASGSPTGASSLFIPDPEDNWWPWELGAPSATGAQNNVRYAYFANSRRLAVKAGGEVWVYDTLDHHGVCQASCRPQVSSQRSNWSQAPSVLRRVEPDFLGGFPIA